MKFAIRGFHSSGEISVTRISNEVLMMKIANDRAKQCVK
jgi:hypothetical protein